MTLLVALLAALTVAEALGALRRLAPACRREALVAWHRQLGLERRAPWLVAPLARLAGRVDPRIAPSVERLLVDLEVGLAAGALLGAAAGGAPAALAGALAAPAGRLAWLAGRAGRREASALRDLPVVLDLLAMGVEGGLPIGAALELTARRGPAGPLRDGLALAVAAIGAGRPRGDALGELSRSLPYPAVAAFVAAVKQSDRLGGRLAPALRRQATQQRTERWQRAERRALLAPVRLLLPLALCIFPATFVLLLVPLALRLAEGFGP